MIRLLFHLKTCAGESRGCYNCCIRCNRWHWKLTNIEQNLCRIVCAQKKISVLDPGHCLAARSVQPLSRPLLSTPSAEVVESCFHSLIVQLKYSKSTSKHISWFMKTNLMPRRCYWCRSATINETLAFIGQEPLPNYSMLLSGYYPGDTIYRIGMYRPF